MLIERKNCVISLETIFVLFFGLFFGIFPQLNIVLIWIFQILQLKKKKVFRSKAVELFITLWVVVRVAFYLQTDGLWINGILEGLNFYMLWQFSLYINENYNEFFLSNKLRVLQIGILLGVFFTFSTTMFNIFTHGRQEIVLINTLQFINSEGNSIFYAKDKLNSYILKNFGNFESGKYRLTLTARVEKMQSINLSLFQVGGKRYNKICKLRTILTICEIEGDFRSFGAINGLFGSFLRSEWRLGNSPIILKDFNLIQLTGAKFSFKLLFKERQSTFTFNENAFGVWMAAIALIVVNIKFNLTSILCFFTSVVLVVASGSRNALISLALAIATSIFWLKNKQIWLIIFLFITFLLFLSYFDIRSINIVSLDDYRDRFYAFRKSIFIWFDSPFFGVKNFSSRLLSPDTAGFSVSHAHNLVLQILGESGLFGLFAFFGLTVSILRTTIKNHSFNLSVFVFVFLVNMVDYVFYYAPIQITFWILISGLLRNRKIRKGGV